MWQTIVEKNIKKNVYICITESLCHVAEINTILTWHQSLFNKKVKKHYKATVIKKCGAGIKTDKQNNGIEQTAQK